MAFIRELGDRGLADAEQRAALEQYERKHHPLTWAIGRGDASDVATRLAAGVDPDSVDSLACPALVRAARRGDPAILRLLLDAGAHLNLRDGRGWTALIRAANGNHYDAVALLLERGADPRKSNDDGHTALMCASDRSTQALLRDAEARWR